MTRIAEFKNKLESLLKEFDEELDEFDFKFKFNRKWEHYKKYNKEQWDDNNIR